MVRKSASEQRSTLPGLERAEDILNALLKQLRALAPVLEPIENQLRVTDFTSSGMYVHGLANIIVCALTADIQGDPIHAAMELAKTRGLKTPAVIKGADRNETVPTCDMILNIIRTKIPLTESNTIINLRWSPLPKIIDADNVVIIGTRYFRANHEKLIRLNKRFSELNIEVYHDDGEFGGGLLVYRLMKLAEESRDITILEITLSPSLANNKMRVAEILESLSSL